MAANVDNILAHYNVVCSVLCQL